MRGENAMDRVEKMLGRMKASKLYRCVDWDPEGKAKEEKTVPLKLKR